MPELPEVEVARRLLAGVLEGRSITRVDAPDRLVGQGADAAERMKVARVGRRGKWLRIELVEAAGERGEPKERRGSLFAHLGMSGRWDAVPAGVPALPYEKLRIVVGDLAAAYVDPRRLGRVRFAEEETKTWRSLGPDALDDGIDAKALHAELIGKRYARSPIKVALLDQRLMAGVGNIHAIEALWRAKIDPRSLAGALTLADARALARAVRASLLQGLRTHERAEKPRYVRDRGAPNPFRIYGHAGEPCPRCRTALAKIVLVGRGTTFCPGCQRRVRRR